MNAVVRQADQLPAMQTDSVTMLTMISRAASDPTVDIEKLERLMAMKERMDAKEAETAFNDSMSDAQAKMRPISADLTNTQTRSKYASYAKLDGKLRPIYTDAGFSLSFDTGDSPKEDHVRVLCYVSHKAGHTRTYKADMPVDGKGAKGNDVMTKTHAFGSGASYGMRYLLKMIFNVAVGEDDNDGNTDDNVPVKDSGWIDAVLGVSEYPAYLEMKKRMLADYGGKPDAIPMAVRTAFNRVAELTKPKD